MLYQYSMYQNILPAPHSHICLSLPQVSGAEVALHRGNQTTFVPRRKYVFSKFCKILDSLANEDIKAVYIFERRLGVGKFGVVNQACLNKNKNKKYAVKSIKIESIMAELKLIENELDILRQVDHPNIIKYYETYNDGEYLHIVTELCTGGELFELIMRKGKFSESEAAKIMEKILTAISFLHNFMLCELSSNLGICYCDIKPENFMFSSSDPDA
eukprot:TRINITY_DN1924_c0_g3_i1.p2 TRINITY_DN1924_c0_g3~~TRINITY_DN1924_c0_g3_i1.p2  ORF type:complete len:215 (+),score=40.96 TRINITY_DN1924_c0_g3_i1:255-899(+)